jgi:hypothetical protein
VIRSIEEFAEVLKQLGYVYDATSNVWCHSLGPRIDDDTLAKLARTYGFDVLNEVINTAESTLRSLGWKAPSEDRTAEV